MPQRKRKERGKQKIHKGGDIVLKQAPAPALLLALSSSAARPPLLLPSIELSQALHLLEDKLEELLATDDLQMLTDLGVLPRKLLDIGLAQVPPETEIQLSGEVVVEFG